MQNSQTNTYEDEAKEFTLTIDYDFDGAVLTSLTSYDDYDIYSVIDAELSPLDVLVFTDRQEADTFSQELRLTSTEGIDFDWMLGAAYYKNDFVQGTLNPGEPTTELGVHVVLPPFQAGLGGLPGDASFSRAATTPKTTAFLPRVTGTSATTSRSAEVFAGFTKRRN